MPVIVLALPTFQNRTYKSIYNLNGKATGVPLSHYCFCTCPGEFWTHKNHIRIRLQHLHMKIQILHDLGGGTCSYLCSKVKCLPRSISITIVRLYRLTMVTGWVISARVARLEQLHNLGVEIDILLGCYLPTRVLHRPNSYYFISVVFFMLCV